VLDLITFFVIVTDTTIQREYAANVALTSQHRASYMSLQCIVPEELSADNIGK
jgi:hypothetical protein